MKIALLAPVEERVPPLKYGGTELVVSNISEGLVQRGHMVDLYATGDSKTQARLKPILPSAARRMKQPDDLKTRESYKYLALGKLLELLRNDNQNIIHNHFGWRLLPFCHLFNTPIVTTLHGPLDVGYQKPIFDQYANHPYVSISNSQRKAMKNLNFITTVYNGIDINKFQYNNNPDYYVAFLGRMSPEKGPKQAIEFAKRIGVKLKMAAKIDTVDQVYYKKEIEPLIDGKQIEYIGEVGPEGKNELLKNAKALIALIQWEEPFGLFIVEAMACGTPVIATRRGAAPELINDGETGYIVNDIRQAVQVWRKIEMINRRACREHIIKNFTVEKMVDGYEKVYQRLTKSL